MCIEINNKFTITNSSTETEARKGELLTNHGVLSTPIFLPVGSQGSVKTVTPDELKKIGVTTILANTYHLFLRPGITTITKLGGLHNFMRWDRPILTDSGGYQVFSLASLCTITDDGVVFRSHIDGSEHFFSPELVIDMQEQLGSDILMVLDECSSFTEIKGKIQETMHRTHLWAQKSKKHYHEKNNLLFAIVQGGLFHDLRKESASFLNEMDFPGYAIGGLSLGEPKEQTWSIVETVIEKLPNGKPRYLMGVGSPEDIIEGISRGIDIFDSALPTRVARNGALYTKNGRINITKSVYKFRDVAIEPDCNCYTCRNFSSAYLHHLFRAGELLAYRLSTIHNLSFMMRLMEGASNSINSNTFSAYKKEFLSQYHTTDETARISQKHKWLEAKMKGSL
jgi:queuine tRNA-ribosyltransferase